VPVPYSIENQWIQTEAQHRESEPPPWYRSPEWVLVIVGCITAIFIAWQSLETRHAARAGQKAAEAALANAKAIIGAERSWITVLPYIWSPTLYPRWEAGDPIPESGVLSPVFHKLPVQIKNTGRTPAKIDELRMFYIHTPQHPTFLPSEPEYGTLNKLHGSILIPQDEILVGAFLSPDGSLTKQEVANIQNCVSYLYAYGIVRYRDYCDGSHEIRFGFVYHFPPAGIISVEKGAEKAAFRKDGPQAYNSHT